MIRCRVEVGNFALDDPCVTPASRHSQSIKHAHIVLVGAIATSCSEARTQRARPWGSPNRQTHAVTIGNDRLASVPRFVASGRYFRNRYWYHFKAFDASEVIRIAVEASLKLVQRAV